MRILQALHFRFSRYRLVFSPILIVLAPTLIFATQPDPHEEKVPLCLRRIRSLALEVAAVPLRTFTQRTDDELPRQPFKNLRDHILLGEILKELKSIPPQEGQNILSQIAYHLSLSFDETSTTAFWDFLKGSVGTPNYPNLWFGYGLQAVFWARLVRKGEWQIDSARVALEIFEKAVEVYRQRAESASVEIRRTLYLGLANRYARFGYDLSKRLKWENEARKFKTLIR